MSVIVAKRQESKVQFIETGAQLLKFTMGKCLKLPKRYTFHITVPVVQAAQEMYKYVLTIKNLYGEEFKTKKIELCKYAIARLEYITFMLDVIKTFDHTITDTQFVAWVDLIEKEIALLNGVIKKQKAN